MEWVERLGQRNSQFRAKIGPGAHVASRSRPEASKSKGQEEEEEEEDHTQAKRQGNNEIKGRKQARHDGTPPYQIDRKARREREVVVPRMRRGKGSLYRVQGGYTNGTRMVRGFRYVTRGIDSR